MEGQPAKRRRVYSVEPNKVVEAAFARNYMNYLVPALMKIKEINTCGGDIQNVVKHEVDMAMVSSAQGFAWSNSLKLKLQNQREDIGVNVNGNTSIPQSPSSESQAKILVSKSKNNDMPTMKRDLIDVEDDDEVINGQLKSLKRLIPGGENMCNDEMVVELESYIGCLQMQVNILQYLADQTS
ncbi:transcription factor bHLH146-like [Lotus japonicus]|uniref:transcription factor bHLH146-like n=1 Tax=Lotus japonicus TaxID=34305 RepID=UPI00258D750C|nr:transcription factor bHLH146-like [Lotus japonicus]